MNITKDNVVVFDEISIVRHRISNLLQKNNVTVFEAANEVELFNILSTEDTKVFLIFLEIGYNVDKSFETLAKVKEKKPGVPIIILTSNNKRQTFVRGITEGASDYILKPFEDDYFLSKVLNILQKKKQESVLESSSKNEIVFDMQGYLNSELRKASKGKYETTVLMCTFFIPQKNYNFELENKYIQVSELFYQSFRDILWETDVFERYGSQTFIGVFPYCGMDNMDKIKQKMKQCFEVILNDNKDLSLFHLVISNITYPVEAENAKELLQTLSSRLIDEIKDFKQGEEEKEEVKKEEVKKEDVKKEKVKKEDAKKEEVKKDVINQDETKQQ